MGKRIVFVVLMLAGAGALVWLAVQAIRDGGRQTVKRSQRERAEAQYSQEIVCDACGTTTTGLVLNRAEAGDFQVCPKCGQKAGRPVIYYMCLNSDCNRQLVKVPTTIWTDEGSSPGGAMNCPKCGKVHNLTPIFLNLESAERIAKETGQDFP